MLNGGAGLDKFVFDTALNASSNVDSVADFTVGQDTFVLNKAVFTSLAVVNMALSADDFYAAAGATAGHDSTDRIIYNTTSGICTTTLTARAPAPPCCSPSSPRPSH